MANYEQAVQEELARQQQLAANDPMYQAEPEWIIREKYSFLKSAETPQAQSTSAGQIAPDLKQAIYKVGNDYYSVAEGKFVDKPASNANVIELGGSQTLDNLRATLEFYKLPVGEALQ